MVNKNFENHGLQKPSYFFEIAGVDGIQLAAGRIVYHVKKCRKRLTQIETAAATVADIKHSAHFLTRVISNFNSGFCIRKKHNPKP